MNLDRRSRGRKAGAMTRGEDMDIPRTYETVPDGFTERDATDAELQAAGFRQATATETHKPGQQPLDEMLVPGETVLVDPQLASDILREMPALVLCDPEGAIVATWDEGRWWTPDESAEFVRRIIAEQQAGADPTGARRLRSIAVWAA
jgi:hypothetical protein